MEKEMTFGDLVREAREIGRRGDREEIDRFTAKSHVHSMIMSGRIGAGVSEEPGPRSQGEAGVFVQIVAGRPVVSIRCSDNVALEELTALARRIMAAIG
ncbi:hypothetical protein [Rhizobium johnstonii]|uniref:hypothetical protein n=1 Tax=Rhizobium johnstonii TaxID=3019933 RepID=UPI003F9DF2C2